MTKEEGGGGRGGRKRGGRGREGGGGENSRRVAQRIADANDRTRLQMQSLSFLIQILLVTRVLPVCWFCFVDGLCPFSRMRRNSEG
jgi:hypothetical protein